MYFLHDIVKAIWEVGTRFVAFLQKKGSWVWMEGLVVDRTSGNPLNHHQRCSCEGPMLRLLAQLPLSSEIG